VVNRLHSYPSGFKRILPQHEYVLWFEILHTKNKGYSDFVVEIGILISSILPNPNSYEDKKTFVPLTVARYFSTYHSPVQLDYKVGVSSKVTR
jgi:hypothetical protein